MWSTIILCNFQSCCCCYFCFGRCIVWGKISNYWLITFWMKNIFYVKSGWSCSMKWGFPRFFFLKKQNWTKMVGYNGLGWNKILMELGWIYTRNFFSEKKAKLKQLEILHRARSWDVETLCSSDFTNQPNWIWILSHIWSAA